MKTIRRILREELLKELFSETMDYENDYMQDFMDALYDDAPDFDVSESQVPIEGNKATYNIIYHLSNLAEDDRDFLATGEIAQENADLSIEHIYVLDDDDAQISEIMPDEQITRSILDNCRMTDMENMDELSGDDEYEDEFDPEDDEFEPEDDEFNPEDDEDSF